MGNLEDLARKLLAEENVTLEFNRYNDGIESEPDILINRLEAVIETEYRGYKDIVVYLLKEDDKTIGEMYEIYRMPMIEDLNVLKYILEKAKEQLHL